MWHLTNDSNEDIEFISSVDEDAPGCRLVGATTTEVLKPNETLCFTYYEPGVSYVIRPANDPERHRRLQMSEACKSIQKSP